MLDVWKSQRIWYEGLLSNKYNMGAVNNEKENDSKSSTESADSAAAVIKT